REAYTPAFLEARVLVQSWLADAGLVTRIDAVGNLFGRTSDPDGPVVLSGSHLDAVRNGGVFDGAAGVVGAVEAVRTIGGGGRRRGGPTAGPAGRSSRLRRGGGSLQRPARKRRDDRDPHSRPAAWAGRPQRRGWRVARGGARGQRARSGARRGGGPPTERA